MEPHVRDDSGFMNPVYASIALAVLSAALFGAATPASKLLLADLTPFQLAGLLYLGGAPNWLCEPTHSPLGLVVYCYAASLLFEEEWRKRAFAALLGGSWLHVLFDLGKNYLGSGVILWAFPFSMDRIELGWYGNEDSIYFMLPALGVILLAEIAGRAFARISGRGSPSP
jgi:hypothetical protein